MSTAARRGPDTPGAAGSWARCVCGADMVGPAPFLGDELGSAWERGLGEGRAAGGRCQEPVLLLGTCGMDPGCLGETVPRGSKAMPGTQGTVAVEADATPGWAGRGGGAQGMP